MAFLFAPSVGKRAVSDHWYLSKDFDPEALAIFKRHYSHQPYRDGREQKQFVGPGQYIVLVTKFYDALFVWRKFIDDSGQQGVNCAVFRNESAIQSSALIEQADELAWTRWPIERHYTYVDARKIRSTNPGYCFLRAGWRRCGVTKHNKLIILERLQ